MIKKLGFLLLGSFLSVSAATAGMIVDTVEQNVLITALTHNYSHSYQHDINDNGFTLGSALSGDLTIDIYDDNSGTTVWVPFFGKIEIPDGKEGGLVVVENFDFDTGGLTGGQNDYYSTLEIQALASLNLDGFLDVTISALKGDFYVSNSVLKVVTADVPESGTLALLGLGLAGVCVSRRRKQA